MALFSLRPFYRPAHLHTIPSFTPRLFILQMLRRCPIAPWLWTKLRLAVNAKKDSPSLRIQSVPVGRVDKSVRKK